MDSLVIEVFVQSLAIVHFFCRRGLRYLRFFQLEEYSSGRFLAWYWKTGAFDRRGTAVLLLSAVVAFLVDDSAARAWCAVGSAVLLLIVSFGEPDPRVAGKVRLNMTERANRIFSVGLGLFLVFLAAATVTSAAFGLLGVLTPILWWHSLWLVVVVQSFPLWLILGNFCLKPAEKSLQRRLLAEAHAKMKSLHPTVVGITGSYGKTSTKAILGEVLNATLAPTFWPPKSFNTPMGITREIRERLTPGYRFAVIEMGAYGIGSVKRLCELTPPKAAIVTAVGLMHLERFGSQENIYKAKSELAQAVPEDGILVCNGDDSGARRMATEFKRKRTLLYGLDQDKGPLDCAITKYTMDAQGTTFTLQFRGRSFEGRTKLLGRPALSNLCGAFCMACELGADPDFVLGALRNIAPVDNRLSIDTSAPGTTYIRDAYNSNPVGFRAALEVLKVLPGNRRIVMSPGMIELGAKQFEENRSVAREAAGVCDIFVVVGDTNRDALVAGLSEGGCAGDRVIICENREVAFSRLKEISKEGDIILLENDLTDLYEARESF